MYYYQYLYDYSKKLVWVPFKQKFLALPLLHTHCLCSLCLISNKASRHPLKMADYAVVEFRESKTVAVIPVLWFVGEEEKRCHWPNTTSNISRLVEEKAVPNGHWKIYIIRGLGKASKSIQHLSSSFNMNENVHSTTNGASNNSGIAF